MTSIFPRRKAPNNLPPPVHWASGALCSNPDVHPDTWFPHPTDAAGIEEAKSFCRRCPAELVCRSDALNRGEEFGVWGGLSEAERRDVRRRVRAARAKETDTDALAPAS